MSNGEERGGGAARLDPGTAGRRARPLDAVAARCAGTGHRDLLRTAERAGALGRAGAGGDLAGACRAGAHGEPRAGAGHRRRRGFDGPRPRCMAHGEPRLHQRSVARCSASTSRAGCADIQRLPDGVRVVLEAVRLRGNGVPPPEMMPAKVRVTLSRGAPPLVIGDRLLVLANLSPPAGRPRRAPSISSGSPGTSSSVPSAMRWRRRR